MAPLAFDLLSEPEGGYIAFVNDAVGNIGVYDFAFFTRTGVAAGMASFLGLQALDTSFTYEDPIITTSSPYHMGRVSVTTGSVKGIATIGGPLVARLPIEDDFGWPGPGDLVQ